MAKPKPKKKGYQAASGGMDGLPIGAALAAGTAIMVILAVFSFSLKSQLIKPGRIVAAAENAGLFAKLPRLMYGQVFGAGAINPKKQLMLKEAEIQELAEEMFSEEWVAEQFTGIIWEAADSIKRGDPIVAELILDDVKGDIASALIGAVKDHKDTISRCSGDLKAGKSICLPKGVSLGLFMNQVGPEIRKVINRFPDNYPLLPRATADQISSATGIFGTLSTLGIVFLILAAGMAGGSFKMHDEDGPSPIMAVGAGLAVGGAVLLVVVMLVKGGISAATGALARSLEQSYATVVDQFFSEVISGGFRFALILAVVSALAGVGLFFWARQNT